MAQLVATNAPQEPKVPKLLNKQITQETALHPLPLTGPNRNGYVGPQPDNHLEIRGPVTFGLVLPWRPDVQLRHWARSAYLFGLTL